MYNIPDGYAVFIRNTAAHFVDRIFDGTKSIETRTAPTLDCCRGKWVKIVKTETREIVGEVLFSRRTKTYRTYAEFAADRTKHHVWQGSPFDWNKTKLGYIILATRKYDTPVPVPKNAKRYGRIAVQIEP